MSLPERKIEAGAWLAAKREQFAMRLAALDAVDDDRVLEVAADFEAAAAGRSYEGVEAPFGRTPTLPLALGGGRPLFQLEGREEPGGG